MVDELFEMSALKGKLNNADKKAPDMTAVQNAAKASSGKKKENVSQQATAKKTRDVKISLRLKNETMEQLTEKSKETDRPVAYIVYKAIEEYFERQTKT